MVVDKLIKITADNWEEYWKQYSSEIMSLNREFDEKLRQNKHNKRWLYNAPSTLGFLMEREGRVIAEALGMSIKDAIYKGTRFLDRYERRHDPSVFYFSEAAVCNELQGNGVGRKIEEAVLTEAANSGFEVAVAHAKAGPSLNLVERLGARRLAEFRNYGGPNTYFMVEIPLERFASRLPETVNQ